jgi:predicted metal-dependent phosphoesterase TrpH
MQVKVDLHVHSFYSKDSLITPQELVFYGKKRGLNAVAVTDHNIWESAQKIAKETADFLIIPGMEVSSADGHIVALNVSKPIPRGLTAKETVDQIHAAGGLAVAAHPYAWFKGSLSSHVFSAPFDAVETVNASAFPFGHCNRKAEEAAEKLGAACVGGTDAHVGAAIGFGYTLVESELTVEAVLKCIKEKKTLAFGTSVPFLYKIEKQYKLLTKTAPPQIK